MCCASSIQIEFPALPANNQTASQLSKDRRLLAAFPTWGPPLIQYLDPETLQPVHAVSLFQVQPKLRGYYMSPHWQRDSVGGQWFGCSVENQLGWLGPYYQLQVLTVPTASEPPSSVEQVKILATLALPHPALIHSFGMTAQFLIIVSLHLFHVSYSLLSLFRHHFPSSFIESLCIHIDLPLGLLSSH